MPSKPRQPNKDNQPDKPGKKTPADKRPFPKVSVSESAASPEETGEVHKLPPKTSKVKQPPPRESQKSSTTRISLPDEAKVRKARRADETKEKLPGAEQVSDAAKNATAPIEIDTENVEAPDDSKLNVDESGDADKTMRIQTSELKDSDAGETSKIPLDQVSKRTESATRVDTGEMEQVSDQDAEYSDRTMKIDSDSLQTRDLGDDLKKAGKELDDQSDATMKVDPDSLQTGDIGEELKKAGKESDDQSDATMKIDPNSLEDEEVSENSSDEFLSQETMKMDTMKMDSVSEDQEDAFKTETSDSQEIKAKKSDADEEPPATKEQLEESFNAQTMSMDPDQLESELRKDKEQAEKEEASPDQTVEMSEQRPKTIMIKRPSRESPSAPTVKTVRPDAQTVRAARPVPKSKLTEEQKESTSRVNVPDEAAKTEGKTVKLRRPGGAAPGAPRLGGPRPGASVSRVASNAGLEMDEDGAVRAAPQIETSLGAGWMVVALLTLLISAGGLWVVLAADMPDMPLPGRLVDAQDNLVQHNIP